MKKILILGASFLQLPGILTAKEMGIYTICLDINPEAIGRESADEFYQVSINDKEKVLEIASRLNVDGIMTLASDQPMNTVSYVGTRLNLNVVSEEVAVSTTNKGIMRQKLQNSKVPMPLFKVIKNSQEFSNIISQSSLPLIVKPTDSSGSRGVQLVNDLKNLDKKFEYSSQYSKNHEVIVEEYLKGREFSVESFTVDGITTVVAITEKETTGPPYFVELGHIIPANITEEEEKEMKSIVIKTINSLEIKNGPTHCELMLTREGAKIIEIGARLGGDNITSHLVPLSTGYNILKATINSSLNQPVNEEVLYKKYALIRFIDVEKSGEITQVIGAEKLEKSAFFIEQKFFKKVGDFHQKVTSSSERIGYFILLGENRDRLIQEAKKLNNDIEILIKEVSE